jgi:TonB family protein
MPRFIVMLGAVLLLSGSGCATKGGPRPASPDRAPLSGGQTADQGPVPLHITQPRYPAEAFNRKIQGTVELEILIDETGRVGKTRLVKSIPELDAAAIQCVMEWRFRPAQLAGQPVATVASAPVTFRITEKE